MNDWWKRRQKRTRKSRKNKGDYTFWDFIIDGLFWIPELIILPLRILFWSIRGMGRSLGNLFDIF